MSKLLAGERPVRVTALIRSESGRAEVDVQRVEISGMVIDGKMLEHQVEQLHRLRDLGFRHWFERSRSWQRTHRITSRRNPQRHEGR